MVVTLLASVGICWVAVRVQRTRAVEEIKNSGGTVVYDYQFRKSGNPLPGAGRPRPAWLRNLLGDDFVGVVFASSATDASLEHLKGRTQLQALNLGGTQVTDAGLEHLKGLTQLQALQLYGTKVTDAGLEHLKGLTQLQALDLSGTQVTDAGLEHLKGLMQLQTLDLHDTKVTTEGVKRLKQALSKHVSVLED